MEDIERKQLMLSELRYHPNMLIHQRRAAILDMVRERGSASVGDLARRLGVSVSTIRRDLDHLDRQGSLRRVRGGGAAGADEPPFAHVATVAPREKDRVGVQAASLVGEHDVVLIDIGTTGARVAHHLRGRDVTVVTASLAVVDELREDRRTQLVVLGGLLRPSYLSLVGALTQQALAQLSVDIAFLGTSGLRADGMVMDTTGTEVPVKHAIIEASDRTCLMATSDKLPGSGVLPVCRAADLHAVITTADPLDRPLPCLEDAGTQVVRA